MSDFHDRGVLVRLFGVLACLCLIASVASAGRAEAITTTMFTAGIPLGAGPYGIAPGPDGNVWFTEANRGRIGRITPDGVVTEFSAGITPGSQPLRIVEGPDGNLWFTSFMFNYNTRTFEGRIGRVTPDGVVTEFYVGGNTPDSLALGPDGNLWFTQTGQIGRITPDGVVTEFSVGITPGAVLPGIALGPDGNLWFTEWGQDQIGRITPDGVVTEFSAGITPGSHPRDIVGGPDGNLWFTEARDQRNQAGWIGRITPDGVVTEFSAGITTGSHPREIVEGPDGNLWFTEWGGAFGRVGRITPDGVVTEFSEGNYPATLEGITVGPDKNLWFTDYAGTGVGGVGRVELSSDPPGVGGESVVEVSTIGARLVADLVGNREATSYQFEYGTTTAYGSSTPIGALSVDAARRTVRVSDALSGLVPDTLYHYRLVASNADGTTTGSDHTFTTSKLPIQEMPTTITRPTTSTTPSHTIVQVDKTPAVVSASTKRRVPIGLLVKGLALTARCNEACSFSVRGKITLKGPKGGRKTTKKRVLAIWSDSATASANQQRRIVADLSSRLRSPIKRFLASGRGYKVTVSYTVRATDLSGNQSAPKTLSSRITN